MISGAAAIALYVARGEDSLRRCGDELFELGSRVSGIKQTIRDKTDSVEREDRLSVNFESSENADLLVGGPDNPLRRLIRKEQDRRKERKEERKQWYLAETRTLSQAEEACHEAETRCEHTTQRWEAFNGGIAFSTVMSVVFFFASLFSSRRPRSPKKPA